MSNKNYHIYREDQAVLERLAEEYRYIGRHVRLEAGVLTVLALPPKKEVKKKVAHNKRDRRDFQDHP